MLASIMFTAEQLYFVCQQSWEKNSECSQSMFCFLNDGMAYTQTINNFQGNM